MNYAAVRSVMLACALFAAAVHGEVVEQPRAVHVSGHGEVRAEPDRATLTLGVESRRPALADARAEVARTVEAVLALTREMKIESKLVRATRIHMQPEYQWGPGGGERKLLGYYVSRQVEVELRDLDKLGQLMERAPDVGVNQLGDPQLDSSRRKELEREALAKAVADARLNAEVVAKAVGATLGPARIVNASTGHEPPRPILLTRAAMAAGAPEAAGTYQSGEMTFSATITVQYDLLVQGGQ